MQILGIQRVDALYLPHMIVPIPLLIERREAIFMFALDRTSGPRVSARKRGRGRNVLTSVDPSRE